MAAKVSSIAEPGRSLPVTGEYDLIVAGGGIAGVAAAVAARRNGASVLLLEKTCALGGLATLGNVIIWLPICDGRGRQVMAGLPEELLKLSVADLRRDHGDAHFLGIPSCWQPGGDREERRKNRYRVEFNPSSYLLALEKLVVDAGVKVLYDTRVCAVQQVSGCITHLIVENKDGRSAFACRAVVDASGDADVCFLAGEETESLDSNVLAGWFYYLHDSTFNLNKMSNKPSRWATRDGAEGPFFRGDNAEGVTGHLLATRELMRKRIEDLRAANPGSDIQVMAPPMIPCFRMTRRLVSGFSLGERHMHEWFEDAIGLTGDWRKAGPVYAVPWCALHGVKNKNLLTAGRCVSADTTVWDLTRAIPTCAMTGTAAGVGAALAVRQSGGDMHALAVPELQRLLKKQGCLLSPELVKPAVE